MTNISSVANTNESLLFGGHVCMKLLVDAMYWAIAVLIIGLGVVRMKSFQLGCSIPTLLAFIYMRNLLSQG
jgi:hypothetical protein